MAANPPCPPNPPRSRHQMGRAEADVSPTADSRGGHPAPEKHGSSLALSLYGGQQRAILLATARNSGFPLRLPVTTRTQAIQRLPGWKLPAGNYPFPARMGSYHGNCPNGWGSIYPEGTHYRQIRLKPSDGPFSVKLRNGKKAPESMALHSGADCRSCPHGIRSGCGPGWRTTATPH